MTDVEVRGVRLHVQRLTPAARDRTPGPVVIAVHGVLGNMSVFYYSIANHIAAAGYEVVLYDLRGHGLSECPPCGYLIEDMVADLEALIEGLGSDRPVHVVGYSLGGTIAQGLTVARPDLVASLILVEGLMGPDSTASRAAREREWMVGDRAAAIKLIDRVIAENPSKGSRWAAKTRRLFTQTTFHAELSASHADEAVTARRIQRPTMVVNGGRSNLLAGAMQSAASIADCTVSVLDGYDHDTILTDGAGAVRARVIGWLDEFPTRTAGEPAQEAGCHASFSSFRR